MDMQTLTISGRTSDDGTLLLDNLPAGIDVDVIIRPNPHRAKITQLFAQLDQEPNSNSLAAQKIREEIQAVLHLVRKEVADELYPDIA